MNQLKPEPVVDRRDLQRCVEIIQEMSILCALSISPLIEGMEKHFAGKLDTRAESSYMRLKALWVYARCCCIDAKAVTEHYHLSENDDTTPFSFGTVDYPTELREEAGQLVGPPSINKEKHGTR